MTSRQASCFLRAWECSWSRKAKAGTRRAPAFAESLAALREPPGVAKVRVPLEERDAVHLVRVRPGVAEHVKAVADVDDVDQAVANDREAPHDNLVRPTREGRVLVRH